MNLHHAWFARASPKVCERCQQLRVVVAWRIHVAADLQAVCDMLTVTGGRVHAELRGVSCLPLSPMAATRQGISVTRTFGSAIETWADLREAVCAYAARAAEKLRNEGLMAERLTVFAHTNPHNGDPWHSAHRSAEIEPTADRGHSVESTLNNAKEERSKNISCGPAFG